MRTTRAPGPRASRSTHRHGTTWTAFIILMMLFSMFSSLVDPAIAQEAEEDSTEGSTEQVTGPVDTDNDGLTDEEEALYGTNPNLADSDQDGIGDYEELMQYGTDPSNADTDGDGLSDYDEIVTYGTNPFEADPDGDGLSDYDEVMTHGTDPNAADTDSDGVNDDVELANGTDPTVADAQAGGDAITEEPESGSVWVFIWECPYDYDPATSGNRDTMRAECDLYDADPAASWRLSPYLNPPIDAVLANGNVAVFDDVPVGNTGLAMLTPQEPVRVYCQGNIAGGGSNTKPYAAFSISNNSIAFDLLPDEQIDCDWFINAAPMITVVFHKYTCDDAYDPQGKSHQDLRDDCRQPNGTVVFDVTGPNGYAQSQAAPQDQSPVTFANIPPGDLVAWETLPSGYGFLYLFCYHDDGTNGANGSSGMPPAPWDPVNLDAQGRVPLGLQSGTFYCDWFNQAPQYDPNYLVVYKHECATGVQDDAPENGSVEESKAYYDAECPTVEGWDFDLEYPDRSRELKRTNTDGMAVWEGVPSGDFILTEALSPGYGEPVTICRYITSSDPSGGMDWDYTIGDTNEDDGTYILLWERFNSGDIGMECHVYNLSAGIGTQGNLDDPSNLTINKRICPVDYDYTAQGADPMVDCTMTAPDGIEFTISDEDPDTEDLVSSTGDQSPGNSYVEFGGLMPGMHTITEAQDPMYEASILWVCDNYQNAVAMPINEGWSYGMDVPPGMDITCDWLNIPEVEIDGDLADLHVYKYMCPVGYDYAAANADPMVDCDPGPNGVTFTLSDDDTNTPDLQSNTGDAVDYRVMFGGLDPGVYTITEAPYPTIAANFLWICDGIANGAVMPWSTTGSYDLMLSAGDMITCHWFNIPTDDDGFSVTLYKYECLAGTEYGNPDPNYYSGECATEQADVPFTLTDGNGSTPFLSDTMGEQLDNVVPTGMGQFILMEDIPDGYGDPVGYCQPVNGPDGTPMTLVNGILTVTVPANVDDDYHCWYYNIPEDPGTVTIYKWDCPEGMEIAKTYDAHKAACVTPLDTIGFTLVDSMGPRAGTTTGGVVEWNDVMIETITVAESIPLGYNPQPYVSCRFEPSNLSPLTYNVYNGVLTATLNHGGQHIICDWFNQYEGPGEVTVYKWECPEGYDRNAWGADPATDCTTPYNGVEFVLDGPEDPDLQSDTGDSIDGAVYFGGLMPGQYTLSEMVPEGIVDVFVLDCVGMDVAYVHPVPLSVGPNLSITVGAGDSIRCDWYNVPGHDPDYGWLTLTKYICSTPKYVSDIDCLVYAGGQQFDVQAWNGATWTTVQSGTTDAAGKLTFMTLVPGTYRLVEPGKTACMIRADRISSDGNLSVVADGGTTVKVYNCGSVPATPKTPTKYPNTGAGPSGDDLRTMDGLSLLGLLGTGAVISRRRFLGAAAVGAGTVALGRSIAAQPVIPLDAPATPDASPAPAADCMFPATPTAGAATPEGIGAGTPVACARGAVPVHIRIPAIEVDAPIEYLEFIEGQMEQPTGETDVAWYKNSARLGEQGNGIYAGHLNWWNVPEAVFFRLRQLREDDVVEIEGDDGETYRYIVQWSEDFPSDEEPPDDAVGHTEEQAITLITCGGEWNAGRAEYDHRTLVRAVRDIEAFASPDA